MSFIVHEAHQILPEFLGIKASASLLHAHLALGMDERSKLGVLDRAILLLFKEYPIAAGHVTDGLGRAGQKGPAVGFGAPELGIVLQHLRRVVLGVEAD